MKQELEYVVSKVCMELFNVDVSVELTRPDEQFGDYATSVALQLGQQLNKNPREIAEKIASKLKHKKIAGTEVAGPGFINIKIQSNLLAMWLFEETKLRVFGRSDLGQGRKVVCEFPSPNMAKPVSVGHLRAAVQGWTIYKLMTHLGYEVVTDNHIGDYGTPFGKWVVGFLYFSSDEKLAKDGIYELARIYIEITAALKTEKEQGDDKLAGEVQGWLKKLEAKDVDAVEYSNRFNKISLDHLHKVMGRLRISTDHELGEAFYVPRGQALTDELLKKGIAKESDGALVVPLDDAGIDTPIMLRKANGTALYATTDLATIEYRQQQWNPEKVFIHTGQEQTFYFRQLKALAKKVGYKDVIEHLWHGLIDQKDEDGTRQKMSSRKGVVLLEELLDVAEKKARKQMKDGNEEDIKAVALGAIKFADFTADRKKGMLFDWESMFSVQGFSGPAVQYAVVRIKSVLAKATDSKPNDISDYDWQAEHALLLLATDFPQLLVELGKNYEMHKLATYLYGLARELNRYYEETQILITKEPIRGYRLWFITVIRDILVDGLDILGIPTPERM
ncbi:arginine--tRNA ligase [Candidatus Saccharibacteria bacterium]|nr:arginine--tRNA ligase [Candidatus Saccharibacteria bacterium]MBI3338474.1 arginine--tRNA ligase [Candidatus Saccharibacteria bacterium]